MGKAAPTGSLVITEKVEFGDIVAGDILTFRDSGSESFFTHRVTRVDAEKKWIYTKGDASRFEDPAPTSFEYVCGRVKITVPLAGYLHMALMSKYGFILIALLVIAGVAVNLIFIKRKD